MDYKSLAKKIFDITGPEENILQASHCMTRLRLQLRHATPEMQIQLQYFIQFIALRFSVH